jgi:GT2 family glycosyltransferase
VIACSVVIPTFRRPDLLARCVDALGRQTLPRTGYEIIVSDDAGDGATEAQVQRWRDDGLPVRYVTSAGTHGPAAARNAGACEAVGELLAFTDDDTLPDTRWLEHACRRFRERPALDAAHGRVVVPLPDRPTDYELDAAGLERAGFVTANCFVRRAIFHAVGGFDEAFTTAWREDSDLFFRLLAAGCRVERIPEAVVVHPVRTAGWGVSVRQQRKSAFDALLFKKHPVAFARYVRPARPTLYYPTVAALAALCTALALGQTRVALAAGAAWAALTGAFAARRLRRTSRGPHHVAEVVVTSALIPPLSLFWRMHGAVRHRVLFW